MKRLLQCLMIPAVIIVGLTMVSPEPAEGARVRVRAYPRPYVARYRAAYVRPYVRPNVPVVAPRPVIRYPVPRPAVYPR